MSAAAILERLYRDGLSVRTDGARVLLSPREKVTPDLLELVRGNKATILQQLVADSAQGRMPSDPAARALEHRRRKVERELVEHPEQRVAFDAVGVPLRPEPGASVSVMLAVRTPVGIVSGELSISREKFDAALFFRTLRDTSQRPS